MLMCSCGYRVSWDLFRRLWRCRCVMMPGQKRAVSERGCLGRSAFLVQVMSCAGEGEWSHACHFKLLYDIIGTLCLTYIFNILSFSVLYFISISKTPDARSTECILVIFFLMYFSMSTVNLKASAALTCSCTAEVETHWASTQCWGQRLILASLNQPLKYKAKCLERSSREH